MIGVSLPMKWLLSGKGEPGEQTQVFAALRKQGVESVEMRTVRPSDHPADVLRAAKLLWGQGFLVTVHGSVTSSETAVQELFAPLEEMLEYLQQDSLTVTIHPVAGDNARMLALLSDHCMEKNLPVVIALENNRLLPGKQEGDCAALVLDAVRCADRKNVGICFDMGHYAYYRKKNCPDMADVPPDPEFLKRVVHTHIHGLDGLRTHFPLPDYPLPLKPWVEAMAYEYFGVYNLELDFPRFQDRHTPLDALLGSVAQIRSALPICAQLYDEVRQNFDGWFRSAASVLQEQKPGTYFGLIHSTSYLFQTDGFSWAMDIAFRNARFLAKTPAEAAELLKPLRLMVITHGHRDHFEENTLRLLAQSDIQWIIPDFLVDKAVSFGLKPERILIARCGEWIHVGPLRLLPFEGRHVRPDSGRGPKEYGYYAETENGPSLVFPGDTRDFKTNGVPDLPKADYCFAHVWLGDKMAMEESYGKILSDWSKFMLCFCKKTLLMTHLYEDGRPDDSMWRERHAGLLADTVAAISPETEVVIPKRGEVRKLEKYNVQNNDKN